MGFRYSFSVGHAHAARVSDRSIIVYFDRYGMIFEILQLYIYAHCAWTYVYAACGKSANRFEFNLRMDMHKLYNSKDSIYAG